MRILIAEDDQSLGRGLVTALEREGFVPEWVRRGDEVLPVLRRETFALLVLDLGLPGSDGLAILEQLRAEHHEVGVLILTARAETNDKITGLNLGADDYLAKPFDIDEFLARLHAIQRRREGRAESLLNHGAVTLNPHAHTVTHNGTPVALSRREIQLLQLLLEKRGRVLRRADLEQQLYRWGDEVESNALEVHIHHLRKKLYPQLVRTVRGVGYTIDKP